MPALLAVVLAGVVAIGLPDAAAAEPAVTYLPPVDAPVVDPFRLPATPFGPGNRGLEYATSPGQPVRAAAGGEVTFAGQVGGTLHVVVLHPDGIRTSYSFLAGVSVSRGDRVAQGDIVGTAGASLHFGARAGGRYIDPALLMAGGPPEVHLIPVEMRRPQSERQERNLLLEGLRGAWDLGARAVGAALDWQGDAVGWLGGAAREGVGVGWSLARDEIANRLRQLELLANHVRRPSGPLVELVRAAERAWRLFESQRGCTPADRPVPTPPEERRIVVLVGGLGSAGGAGDALDVDTRALGFADADRVQFSYRGGRVEGVGSLDGVPTSTYGPGDTGIDLRIAGRRFRELLVAVRMAEPGVPVDVIAQSQGGLVVRSALGDEGDALDPRLPAVEHLVTLGAPHSGTDLATVAALMGTTGVGQLSYLVSDELTDGDFDPAAPSIEQMDETSDFQRQLGRRPVPGGTRVTSIAARGDLVVPALNSSLEDATNVIVPLDGLDAHADLPGSDLAEREMALALGDQGPTCTGASELVRGAMVATGISQLEQTLGEAAVVGALWIDRRGGMSLPTRTRRPVPAGGADAGAR